MRRIFLFGLITLGTKVRQNKLGTTEGESLIDRHIAVAGGQRIVGHILFVSEASRFVGRGFAIAVVASKIVIVPDVNERDVAVELGLLRRRKNQIVCGAELSWTVAGDVQIMKVADVHEEQRVIFPDRIKNIAGRRGFGAGGIRKRERSRSFRESPKLALLVLIDPAIDFQRIMILRIRLQSGQRELHHVILIGFRANGTGVDGRLERSVGTQEQACLKPSFGELCFYEGPVRCNGARPRPAIEE